MLSEVARQLDDPHMPRRFFAECFQHAEGVIRRAVIDEDYFPGPVHLLHDGREASPQIRNSRGLVVDRDHQRNHFRRDLSAIMNRKNVSLTAQSDAPTCLHVLTSIVTDPFGLQKMPPSV